MENEKNELREFDHGLSEEALKQVAARVAEIAPQVSLVRRFRTALGLSQTELAQILSLSQSGVSKVETRNDPTLSTLAKMAEARGGTLSLELKTADGAELRFALA